MRKLLEAVLRLIEHWLVGIAIVTFGMAAFYEPSITPGQSWKWLFWLCIGLAALVLFIASTFFLVDVIPEVRRSDTRVKRFLLTTATALVSLTLVSAAAGTIIFSADWFDNREMIRRCKLLPNETFFVGKGEKRKARVCKDVLEAAEPLAKKAAKAPASE